MDSNEKKIKSTMEGVIKDLVLPRLDKIEEKLTAHDEKLEMIIEAVTDTKVEITEIKEDFDDEGYTIERIETRLKSVIGNQDDLLVRTKQLNHRVLKLETKKS